MGIPERTGSSCATDYKINPASQRSTELGGAFHRPTQHPDRQVGHGGAPAVARGIQSR